MAVGNRAGIDGNFGRPDKIGKVVLLQKFQQLIARRRLRLGVVDQSELQVRCSGGRKYRGQCERNQKAALKATALHVYQAVLAIRSVAGASVCGTVGTRGTAGIMIPARFKGSCGATTPFSNFPLSRRTARSRSTASGGANCS